MYLSTLKAKKSRTAKTATTQSKSCRACTLMDKVFLNVGFAINHLKQTSGRSATPKRKKQILHV